MHIYFIKLFRCLYISIYINLHVYTYVYNIVLVRRLFANGPGEWDAIPG